MTITDEAKIIINEALDSNGYDCLKAMLQKSCCGTSLYFTLTKLQEGDNPISINGIPVLMDDETQEKAKTVTIAVKDGELVIRNDSPSCCG